MFRNLPIRVRLTLWYSLVIALTLLTIGSISLWLVHRAIGDLENEELQQRVRSVRRFVESRTEQETPVQLHDAITAAFEDIHGNKWLQVIDEHGNWLYRSPHVAAIYPTLVLPQFAAGNDVYFTYVADSLHVRALIAPITVHGVRYTVQTGLTLNRTLDIFSDMRLNLSILIVSGLLVSSLAGYFMSRKALTPIAAIATEAQRINHLNLNSRLPELKTRDELAALSQTLNQMLGRIEDGYRSVRSFTANAAHELRGPVARLHAEAEVALAFPREAGYYRNTCQHILDNSEQMSRLIEQLLMLARADAGVETLKFEPLNLPELIEEARDEWSERFQEAGIDFRCDRADRDFLTNGDYLALKRLLNILLENAWRYTPTGRSVTLALHFAAQSDRLASELRVADTGIGVATKDQSRIFDRFYRAATPLHGSFTGTGLGLTMAKSIAERHGTKIAMQSSPGWGSCFSVCFLSTQDAALPLSHQLNDVDESRERCTPIE